MAIELTLRALDGSLRTLSLEAGDEITLEGGETIAAVVPEDARIEFQDGNLVLSWDEGRVLVTQFAAEATAAGENARDGDTDTSLDGDIDADAQAPEGEGEEVDGEPEEGGEADAETRAAGEEGSALGSALGTDLIDSQSATPFPEDFDGVGRGSDPLVRERPGAPERKEIREALIEGGDDDDAVLAALTSLDNGPTVALFSVGAATAVEGGTLLFTVTRTGKLDVAATVDFSTQSGTALSASDFQGLTGTLEFAPGEVTKVVAIATTDDAVFEGPEAMSLVLSQASDTARITSASATGSIEENEAPPVFSIAGSNTVEGGTVTFTITRDIGTVEPTQTVLLGITGGTATAGSDFVLGATSVSFLPGETSRAVTVVTNEDAVFEGDETFTVSILAIDPASSVGTGSFTTTITDNDPAPTVSIADASAVEGGVVTVTVTRTSTSGVAQSVELVAEVGGGTATAADFNAETTTVTFAPGELVRTVDITTLPDLIAEGNETFDLRLQNPTGGLLIGAGTATATIVDDDLASFVVLPVIADETDGTLVFTVTRTLDSGDSSVDIQIDAGASTATAGTDYVGVGPTTLNFTGGALSQTFTVSLIDDGLFEGDETLTVRLSNNTPGLPFTEIGTPQATATITSDDAAPVFDLVGPVSEDEGNALVFTVNRTGDAEAAQSVSYAAFISATDSAEPGDFTPASGTLNFAPGATSATFTVTTTDDTIFEGNEIFTVRLSGATGGAQIGTATTTGEIRDNDAAPSFSVSDATAAEGAPLVFTITRSATSEAPQTVELFTVAGGDAEAGDFTAIAPGSLVVTFAPGETSKQVSVLTTADNIFEGDETVAVMLGSPGLGGGLTDADGVGTITDDEALPSYQFSAGSFSAFEGNVGSDGSLVLTIVRDLDSEQAQDVTVSTAIGGGDTAMVGDFTPLAAQIVTFNPGELSKTVTVTLGGDTVFEGDETFTASLALTNPAVQQLGAQSTTSGVINNDDVAPMVSIDDVTVQEGSGNLVFTVSRSNASETDQTFFATTVATDGADPDDYTALVSAPVSFTGGALTVTVVVAVQDDAVFEGSESLGVQLSGLNFGSFTDSLGLGTITEDDARPTFAVVAASAGEGGTGAGGSVVFTITRTGDAEFDQTINFATSLQGGDTAEAGDFVANAGAVTFAQGELTKQVNVDIVGDESFEIDETFTFALSAGAGVEAGDITAGTVQGTILNDELAPTFNVANTSADEGDPLTFQVTLSSPAEDAQSVTITAQNAGVGAGFAVQNADYIPASTVLTFAPGETSKTFTVASLQDGIQEGNEIFEAVLSVPTGGAVLGTATATGTVVDDDIPTFNITNVQFVPTAGSESGTVVITVERTLDAIVAQQVDFATSIEAGNTAEVADFTAAAGTLTFNPGEFGAGGAKSFTVTLTEDTTFEGDETFTVSLSNARGGIGANIGLNGQAEVTITDDDGAPNFTIAAGAGPFLEGTGADGAVVFTVTRSTGDVEGTQTVDVSTSIAGGDTAEVGDFTPRTQTLTFANGETTKTFTVTTLADAIYEEDETFTATLSNPTGGATIGAGATPISAQGTITDDELEPQVSVSDVALNEGDAGVTSFVFTVTRTGDAEAVQQVDYTTVDGTATAGSDYTAVAGTLSFSPGQDTLTVTVNVSGDTVFEASEAFQLQLSNPTNDLQIADATGDGTVLNDDAAPQFSVNDVSVVEGGQLVFTVSRDADSQADQTVNFAIGSGGADPAEGTDFDAVAPGTLTFTQGQLSQTVVVNTVQDNIFEASEGVQLTLSGPSFGGLADATGLGSIDNDDLAPVFNIAVANGAEGNPGSDGSVTFTITRVGDAENTQQVDATLAIAGGDTAEASDFSPAAQTQTLTFATGVTSQTFTVTLAGDSVYEQDETFTVNLSNVVGGASIGTGSAQGTINDDEALPSYQFSAATYNGAENAGGITITVTRDLDSEAAQTVRVSSVLNGSAEATDFTALSAVDVVFNPGQFSRTVTLNVADDTIFEGDEDLGLTLAVVDSGVSQLGAQSTATVTINEDDAAPTFAIADVSGNEGGTAVFTITRTGDAEQSQSVILNSSDGTATGADYNALVNQVVTFDPGVVTRTVVVTLPDDALSEGNETFTLTMSAGTNVSPADIPAPGNDAVGTIIDDDIPTYNITDVQFVPTAGTESGIVRLTVSRTLDSVATQMVDIDASIEAGDTAEVADFGALSQTLTFNPGQFTQTVDIAINEDVFFEGDETFTVALSNATGGVGANVGLNGSVSVTISDDEAAPVFTVLSNAAEEGDPLSFTISRNVQVEGNHSVDVATSIGAFDTAEVDDFAAVSTTLNFASTDLSQQFVVNTNEDGVFEQDETFTVTVSNATGGATIVGGSVTGTIQNDDAAPTVSITAASVTEGGQLGFLVTLSSAIEDDVTVELATSIGGGDTAEAGDFTPVSGQLVTITAGTTQALSLVATTADAIFEGNETLTATLSNPTGGAVLGTAVATGTIVNDETAPSLSIDDVSVSEGGQLVFTVTRSGDAEADQTVNFVVNGAGADAAEGGDFSLVNASNTLTFSQGELTQSIVVDAVEDAVFEAAETLEVVLSGQNFGTLADDTGVGTILNDDAAPTFSISAAPGLEGDGGGGGTVVVTVTRSADSENTQSVDVATSIAGLDTAEAGDFAPVATTLTFNQGTLSQSFTVALQGDAVFEDDETFTVTLSNATGGALIGTGTTTGIIVNDEALPSYQFSQPAYSANENGGTLTVTVIRDLDSEAAQTVRVSTALGGSAEAGDFVPLSAQDVVFAPGEFSRTVDITINDDAIFEGDETFNLTLAVADGSVSQLGAVSAAVATITEDDAAPSFSIDDVAAGEGGSLVFTVTRTGAAEFTQSVTVNSVNGTATADAGLVADGDDDFNAISNIVLDFAPGVMSRTVVVSTNDDPVAEGGESFTLVLSAPTNQAVIADGTGVGTIIDDDVPRFDIGDATVNENAGTITFTVTRDRDAPGVTQTVEYAVTPDTAVTPGDYGAGASPLAGTLSFAAGVLSQTITLNVVDDTTFEGPQTFDVGLSNPLGGPGAVIGDGTAVGTIIDDDATPLFSIAPAAGNEGSIGVDGSVTFIVTRSTGDVEGTQTVDFATSDGTAIAGSDYTADSGTLSFAAGETSKSIVITTTGDAIFELDETFTVTLSNATGLAGIDGAAGSAQGTISNDEPVPTVSIGDAVLAEGDAGTAVMQFTVTRSGLTQAAQSVDFATADGTAVAGVDYVANSGTLNFAPGQLTAVVSVTVNGDAVFEADEAFVVNLSNALPAGQLTIADGQGSGQISNDDNAPSFTVSDAAAAEGGSLVFTVSRDGDAQADQDITFSLAGGGGANDAEGSDFTLVGGTTLTFSAGVLSQTVVVNANADGLFETDEQVTLTLNAPSFGGLNDATGIGTITNTTAQPVYSIADAAVDEDAGTVTFTVTRTGDAEATQSVDFATVDGSAVAGSDYTAASGTLSFVSGDSSETFTVAITDDNVFEGDEGFTVNLVNPSAGVTIGDGTAAATITENDLAPTYSIVAGAYTVNEEAGTITFTIERDRLAEDAQTVQVSTVLDGTAEAGDIVGLSSQNVVFNPGQLTRTVIVSINDDNIYEGANETFSLSLAITDGTTQQLGTPNQVTATITETDAAPTFLITGASAVEAGSMTFTVTRTGRAEEDQTINFTTADSGSATAGVDYTAESGALVFSGTGASTTRSFTVSTLGDTDAEGNETFNAVITAGAGVQAGDITVGTAQGQIVDDDIPRFDIGDVTVSEAAGTITFTVTRDRNAPGVTQTVDYAVTDGTAVTPEDYTAASPLTGSLNFADGVLSQTITLNIVDDGLFEGDQAFNVALSNAAGGPGAVIGDGNAVGTITDNDGPPSVSISDPVAIEGVGLVFVVTRSADANPTQTVSYTTSVQGGDSAETGDFTPASGVLTFTPGNNVQSFVVATTDDGIFEGAETFSATLSGATGGLLIADGSATGTINDNDARPTFSVGDATVLEGNGGTRNLTFTISRAGDAESAQTVNYATSDGTAVAGTDYLTRSGSVTFNQGETSKTVVVTVLGDSVFEASETFALTLTAGSNVLAGDIPGPGNVATGTIQNDDAAPQYSIAPASGDEGTGPAGSVVFTVSRDRLADQSQDVDFSVTVGGTASAGDFTATSGTLTFNPGELSRTFVVSTTGDAVFEANETFTATISNPTGGGTISVATAQGTILDDEAVPTISFAGDAVAGEGGTMVFTLNLSGAAQAAQSVTVNSSVAGAFTAEADDIVALTNQVITFAPGTTSRTVVVGTNEDTVFEGDETFGLTLSNVTGGAALGGASTATGTITDDDGVPAVQFSAASFSAAEGDGSNDQIVFTLTRDRASESAQTVNVTTSLDGGGSAAEAGDFTALSGAVVTFAPGTFTTSFTVTTLGDTLFELDETFTVSLSGAPLGAQSTAQGVISNDDSAPTFTIEDASGNEGDGITFTVRRTGNAEMAQTVEVSTAGGVATSGTDFGAVVSQVVSFAENETVKFVTVNTIEDAVNEGNETFSASLANPTGGAALGGVTTATGTIIDDDIPVFSVADATVTEGGDLIFRVSRSLSAAGTQTVDIAITGGTAAGSDFTATSPQTLTFTASDTFIDYVVGTTGDVVFEADETVEVTLSNATGGASISPAADTATGTIEDNEAQPQFSVTGGSVVEGGSITFTITRSVDAQATQTVDVATLIQGTDTASVSDFTALPTTTLTFNQGDTSKTVVVSTVQDGIFEVSETFSVQLSNATGGAGIAAGVAQGIIDDDDLATTFSIGAANATEGGNVVFTVTRSGPSEVSQTVNYATSSGSAISGVDFTAAAGALVFAAGVMTRSFAVATTNDTDIEGDETFTVSLSGAGSGTATGTIIDNDTGGSGTSEILIADLNGSNGFIIAGLGAADVGDVVGAGGDVDGDGRGDLLVGGPGLDVNQSNAGGAYFVKATAGGGGTVNLDSLPGGSGAAHFGTVDDGRAGTSIDILGDVNRDGLADYIIGSPTGNQNGAAHVFFGSSSPATETLPNADLIITGGSGATLGRGVSGAGDFNGDGIADILVGSPGENLSTGAGYIVFGSTSLSGSVAAATLSPPQGIRIAGANIFTGAGIGAAGGFDINRDGFDDVVIAAPQEDSLSRSNNGVAYLVFGSSSPTDVNLASLGGAGIRIEGPARDATLGLEMASLGDINGDGYEDIIFGVEPENEAYVLLGKAGGYANLDLMTLAAADGFKIVGQAGIKLGSGVAGGDFNGDGFDDILVTAPSFSVPGGLAEGASYVIYGQSGSFGASVDVRDLDGSNGLRITGDQFLGGFGADAAGAGDVNGDGFEDFLIGSVSSGESAVVYGGDFNNQGTASQNLIAGANGASLVGGAGDDTLNSAGFFSAVQRGGAGDDRLVVNGTERSVDGGTGTDTLAFASTNLTLDFSAVSQGTYENVERVDMSGAGNNSLRLTLSDVLNLSESSNQLFVEGDGAGDSVQSQGQGWVRSGTVNDGGTVYDRFVVGGTAAELLVEQGLNQSLIS